MKTIYRIIFIIVIFNLLCSCASSPKGNDLDIFLQAVNYLNPNIYNQPAPVVVIIYQLKSATAFSQADFFSLYNHADSLLGADLLDKHEIEIRPQQNINLPIAVLPSANYIGILAAFRDPDKSEWRRVINLSNLKKSKLRIDVESQSIFSQLTN